MLLGQLSKTAATAGQIYLAKRCISNVTVVGSGLMGSGIAQVAAASGNSVNVIDVNEQALVKSKSIISKSVERVAKNKFKDDPSKAADYGASIIQKINFTTDLTSVKNSDLVLEAIVESLEAKKNLFKSIEQIVPSSTILASNTSSIPIAEIAANSSRKDKFAGLHFFNPVPVMKLLEVVRTSETSDETYETLMKWGQTLGKATVTCQDTPGFIVNRLLVPYCIQAVNMLERGDASTRDIDTAMKLGAGYKMGPFELMDYVGIDVILFIVSGWEQKFPNDPQFKVPEIIKKMVKEGKLGTKAGQGFYNYEKH